MQAVFEKIIDNLYAYSDIDEAEQYGTIPVIELDRAIESVKQEAEQYNNGWIPCNELLPAYGQTVLASVCAEDAEWKIIIACYKEEDFWLDGKIDAWQPLPTPYANGE